MAAPISAAAIANGSAIPPLSIAHTAIPASMKIPGRLKLRKLRIPIMKVNATATRA
ncbi:MAG: hypothetical protein M5U08_09750 [Burkholderiales bacterium]|nr:hypothetical protein [Burkholderiales bacterium]